jgi:hypothetical protein
VVEYIECFSAKFEVHIFSNCELFEESHVEVRAGWKTEQVSPSVSIRKTARRSKRITIVESRSLHSSWMWYGNFPMNGPDNIWIGNDCADRISRSRIVAVASIDNAERRSGLENGQVR